MKKVNEHLLKNKNKTELCKAIYLQCYHSFVIKVSFLP